ncbi:MAG TPA: response regulator [Nodosilinea sp.]|nr:response regulator [Nodosilinea sp.]
MSYESQTLSSFGILKDVQILVVDNDADSRCLYKVLFEIYGAQVTTVDSIADSMTLLEYLVPDILVCELRFLNEDVWPLIQRIKAVALGQGQRIPILVASASCAVSFAQKLLPLVDDYLLKPVDVNHLVDDVWNLVHLAKATKVVNIQDWVLKHKDWAKDHATATTHPH